MMGDCRVGSKKRGSERSEAHGLPEGSVVWLSLVEYLHSDNGAFMWETAVYAVSSVWLPNVCTV